MPKRRQLKPYYIVNLLLSFVGLSLIAVAGVRTVATSSAATVNPYGVADSCALENNTTVIYGWASDPNATSLTQPSVTVTVNGNVQTAPTNRAGYRDAGVSNWIDIHRPGDPKPGTYGFRVAFTGLYKGTQYPITGMVINEGPGSTVSLGINIYGHIDGDASKPYFVNNLIPDACLATAPPPSPQPTPTPTPAPSPAPTKKPVGTALPLTKQSGTASVPPSLSADATAKITAGTLAAKLEVSSGNADHLHVMYAANPVELNQSSPDLSGASPTATFLLNGLQPQTTYMYQIVRSDSSGKTTTSPNGSFTTLGYIIAVHFVDGQDKAVQGIPATLSGVSGKKTSDDAGNVQFTDIAAGNYTLTFTYNNHAYTQSVAASSSKVDPTAATDSQVVTLDNTVNIDQVVRQQTAAHKSSSAMGVALALVALVVLIGATTGFIIWRRKRREYQYDFEANSPPPPLPEYKPLGTAEHMGESLKDMVLRSMQEEAKRRNGGQQ